MNHKFSLIVFVLLSVLLISDGGVAGYGSDLRTRAQALLDPLSTSITYQARLQDVTGPITGNCDFEFRLFGSMGGSDQVGSMLPRNNIPLDDGYFTIPDLDFGLAAFDGEARYLEIDVRCPSGTGSFEKLSPRQALTAAPYALYAPIAGGAPWSGLTGLPSGFADGLDDDTTYSAGSGLDLAETVFSVDNNITQARVSSSCPSGSSIRVINVDGTVACETDTDTTTFWSLNGDSGTDSSSNYLGTSDFRPLVLRVNSIHALRLEPTSGAPNFIGGYSGNAVTAGALGATIGGGGATGEINLVTDIYGTVGGGIGNQAGNNNIFPNDAYFATVAGGHSNIASGTSATVGGGASNTAGNQYATVGGGGGNTASADFATISGGGAPNPVNGNRVTDSWGTVGGGYLNRAGDNAGTTSDASFATVAGGFVNIASGTSATVSGGGGNTASNQYATVSGGNSNTASNQYATVSGGELNTASDLYAMVPGGSLNEAGGQYSFAAGRRAKALYDGAFVWADSINRDFTSTFTNTFNVRATGGFEFVAGIDGAGATTWSCSFTNGSSWSCSSDRELKENFQAVDGGAILEKLSALPLFTWNAKGSDPGEVHLGPTAQDFSAAFGLGEDDLKIATIDLDGVALAAIQGLYQLGQDQDALISDLQEQITSQQAEIDSLEARLTALERDNLPGVVDRSHLMSYMPYFGLTVLGLGVVWLGKKKGGAA